ncbi:MAG: hypothetical protein ACO3CH_00440 [Ilumatobacteraceae bacterium]
MANYTDEDEIREIKATLDSLAALVKSMADQLSRIELSIRNSSPTPAERLQAVSGSKSSVLSNLPSIGSMTTK